VLYYFAIFGNKISISDKKQFRSFFGTKVYAIFSGTLNFELLWG
jgi:hypothetical protein